MPALCECVSRNPKTLKPYALNVICFGLWGWYGMVRPRAESLSLGLQARDSTAIGSRTGHADLLIGSDFGDVNRILQPQSHVECW